MNPPDHRNNHRSSANAGPPPRSLSANAPAFYPSSTSNRDMLPPPPRHAAIPPPQHYYRQSHYPGQRTTLQNRWGPRLHFPPPPPFSPPPRPALQTLSNQQTQPHQKTHEESARAVVNSDRKVEVEVKREQTEKPIVPIKSCFKHSGQKRASERSADAADPCVKASRNEQSTSRKQSTSVRVEPRNDRHYAPADLFTIDRQRQSVNGKDAQVKRVKKEFTNRDQNVRCFNASAPKALAHLNEPSGQDTASKNDVVDLTMDSPAKNTHHKPSKVQELDVPSNDTDSVSTHVIFAIDCSRSMEEVDVQSSQGRISRWAAVFKCVDTFLVQQRNSGPGEKIFVSLLIFNNYTKVLINRMHLDDRAKVRAALKRAETNRPRGGTSFSAGFKGAYELTKGSDKDKIMVVFLSDGRPGDLHRDPPAEFNSEMQRTFRDHGKEYQSASHWIDKMNKSHKQVNLQFICLYDEGKQWMEWLSKRYKGTFHNPDLSLDDNNLSSDGSELMADDGTVMEVKVKSNRTVLREKYERAKKEGEIISVDATTTRSSIMSTFSSISATVTEMRSARPRERDVVIRAESAMITYQATRMILATDADGNKSFVVAPGETANERTIQVSMHPFAQGGLRNVYRMKQMSGENSTLIAVAKESRHDIKYQERLKFHLETAISQERAKRYARSFQSSLQNIEIALEILPIKVLRTEVYRLKAPSSPGGFRYLAVENQLTGQYTKYNNNDGYVNQSECIECQVAQAFSHFSFIKSKGKEMVVDIQGSGTTYTDPQLHSLDKAYGRADRGEHGFARFFKTHKCNSFCKALGLPEYQG